VSGRHLIRDAGGLPSVREGPCPLPALRAVPQVVRGRGGALALLGGPGLVLPRAAAAVPRRPAPALRTAAPQRRPPAEPARGAAPPLAQAQ
ncbi:unnamed protein product, partial [Heterosigma akashiwo]